MSQVVLPKNVSEFVRTDSGSHLLLLLLEQSFGHSLQRTIPLNEQTWHENTATTQP
ncbi:hypothetical protein C7459_109186 [Tumebacillus permanentifrigoris]|uniref:Uncharacterized protein n=1 Tax=Tumebacillus permanentifrigoris TaxID=378543 RepID=A0A316D9P4_9BACL|nr:hypothetical protein C7459_109186 [Tumebacillus permanentifrigoris]